MKRWEKNNKIKIYGKKTKKQTNKLPKLYYNPLESGFIIIL